MTGLAQTNVQLFNRLAAEAYPAGDIALVARAYGLAMTIFSGIYRSSGKTFVAHAVGTADAVVALRPPAPLVAAALLHAAYAHGDFGSLDRIPSERKRSHVRNVVGDRAEALVYAYTSFVWNGAVVRDALAAGASPDADTRDVLLMRLANEADEFDGRAAHYAPDHERRVEAARTMLPDCAKLAERLGATELAARLAFVRALTLEAVAAAPPAPLGTRGESMLVPPASYALRTRVRLRRFARRLRERVRR